MNFPKVHVSVFILTLIITSLFSKPIQASNNTEDSLYILQQTSSCPIIKVIENKDTIETKHISTEKLNIQTYSNREDKVVPNTNYKKYAVGAINESSQINPNGSSSVNVKIDLPSSPYLFQPTLSLCYNSMNMIGDLGWGWNIAGTSYITKTNKSIYFDGITESPCVENDTTGIFCLDGTRLIKTTSSSTCIHYESIKGQVLVKAILRNGNISYFEVRYPNGNIGYFKNHSKNRYYLSEAINSCGQHIFYNYLESEQGLLLAEICYAHKRYQVKFNYETTSEASDIMFLQGEKYTYNKLLSNIEITINSKLWRKYIINYEKRNGTNFVSQIWCKDSQDNTLPPLDFKYGNESNSRDFSFLKGQLTKYFPFEKPSEIIAQKGKFEYGIASEGIVLYPNYIPNVEYWQHKTAFRHSTHYFANQFSETQEIVVAKGLEDNISFDCGKLTAGKGFNGIICADIDKEPGDEIIKFNDYLNGDKDEIEITAYCPSIYGGLAQKYKFTQTFNNQYVDAKGHSSIYPKNFYIGDFNGDGINEVLVIMPANLFGSGNTTKLYLINLSTNKVYYQDDAPFTYNLQYCKYDASNGNVLVNSNEATQNSDKLFVMDVDGDGKSEIVHINENGTSTYTFDWSTPDNIKCKKIYFDALLKKENTRNNFIYQAHLNSDNLIDFIITPEEGHSNWNVFLSKGNGKYEHQVVNFPSSYNSNKTYFFQDVNHDGKSDLVEYKDDDKSIKIYITSNLIQPKETISSTIEENILVVPASISSRDWTSCLLSINSKGAIIKYLFQENDFNNKLLIGYTNSFGVAKLFTYQNLYSSEYISSNNAQFPFVNYKGALLMVSKYKVEALNKTLSDIDYLYRNAVVHKQGLGFKGYEFVSSFDNITGESSRTQFDVFHQGNIIQTESTNLTTTNEYSINIDKNKIDRSVLKKTITSSKANNLTTTEDFEYDQYLNLVSKITNYGNDYLKTDNYEYNNFNNEDIYILRQLSKEEHEINRNGSSEILSTNYTYKNNMVAEKKSFANRNLVRTEEYSYNSDGQNTSSTKKNYNSPIKHTTFFEYNENGLISSKTGNDGLTQTFKYDELDRMITSNDYNGITNYTYNGWGTLLSTTKSDKTKAAQNSLWSDGEAGSIFKIVSFETGKPNLIKFYDEQGQIVREGSRHYDGNYLFIDKEYDSQGHVASISEPFKNTCSSNKYIYNYDIYGRLTSIVSPKGNTNTYTYNGLTISIYENGNNTTRTYNELNDLLSIDSHKGKILYNYDGGGRIIEEISGNTKVSFKYDQLGRLSAKVNPYLGTKTISYDEEGNIVEENDGEKSTFYSYDSFGHIITKKVDDAQTFNYSYNIYGELESVTSNDGKMVKYYTYDSNHHINSITEKYFNNELVQTYNYANGHISSINYKSNKGLNATEHYIYENDVLTEINLNGKDVIWQLNAEDEQGKAISFSSLGNDTKYTYNNKNNLSSIGVYRNNNLLWKEEYQIDDITGNLLTRTNHHGLTENFKYDDMDRIISVNTHKITYDENGNITESDNVGQYNYNPNRPNELASITANKEDIPLQNIQEIKYNSTLQPLLIENDSTKSEFIYGENGQRTVMKVYNFKDILEKSKYYFGNKYEIVETPNGVEERLFLAGDAYNSPAVLIIKSDSNHVYQITRDYQGSIKAVFDSNGKLIEELSFDPWGRMQNPKTGYLYSSDKKYSLFLDRGYTGHEHLIEYQLINMNGRLYNPILGRFLSPDPILADYTNPQNYNCYAYALNNPLKYVDKNGKNPFVVIGAIIGAYLGGSIANHNFNPTKWSWNTPETYLGMIFGGVIGAVGGYQIYIGAINVSCTIITPFVSLAVSCATNEHKQHKLDFEYTTSAGGYFNSEIYKAEKNASKAYDEAVTTMRHIYSSIQTDLSNISLSDIATSMLENSHNWVEKNINTGNEDNMKMYWFSDTAPNAGGVATLNSLKIGKSLFKYGSLVGEAYATTDTFYSSTGILLNNNIEEREKWVKLSSNIMGFVGGIALGTTLGAATSVSGPTAIAIGTIGYLAGNEILGYVGGFVGGILYDTYQAYRFYKSIQEINDYSRNFQNTINF